MSTSTPSLTRRHARGFSLIEMMVGIVVGLVGLLVIYKTLSVWDNHTRTTIAGGDAQTSGTLAMFNLERDIKLAGMGFGDAPTEVMGCLLSPVDNGRIVTPFNVYPVQIVPGDSDQINVMWGTSSFSVSQQTFQNVSPTVKKMTKRDGLVEGDVVLITGNGVTGNPGSADCQLAQITDNTLPDLFSVGHAGAALAVSASASYPANSVTTARYNAPGGTATTFTAGTLFDLGPTPSYNQWLVVGHSLTRSSLLQSDDRLEIADGVVAMKAEYGYDADGNAMIGNTEWTTTLPTDWTRVRAIRVALLVRSDQFEKPESSSALAVPPTVAAPTWSHGNPALAPSPFVMKNVNGSPDSFGPADPDPQNWRYYRYRVYEKVIPLRNMIWGTAPTP